MYHSSPAYVRGAAPARRCFQSETAIYELPDIDSSILLWHDRTEYTVGLQNHLLLYRTCMVTITLLRSTLLMEGSPAILLSHF